jgi:hypothetical protein
VLPGNRSFFQAYNLRADGCLPDGSHVTAAAVAASDCRYYLEPWYCAPANIHATPAKWSVTRPNALDQATTHHIAMVTFITWPFEEWHLAEQHSRR